MKARCRFFQAVTGGERIWLDMDVNGKDGQMRGTYEGSPSLGVLAFLETLDRDQVLAITHDMPVNHTVTAHHCSVNTQWNAFVYYVPKGEDA
jgi:hypothetical protein